MGLLKTCHRIVWPAIANIYIYMKKYQRLFKDLLNIAFTIYSSKELYYIEDSKYK